MNGKLTPIPPDVSIPQAIAPPEISFNPSQASGFDSFYFFWRLVRRRRICVFVAIVICVAIAILASLIMKPVYSSSALIELNKSNSGMDFGLDGSAAASMLSGDDELLTQLQTETSVLQSDSLALDVVQRLNLENSSLFATKAKRKPSGEDGLPLEKAPKRRTQVLNVFSQHLKIAPVRGTRLLRVSFEDHDPDRAAQIANALVDSYKNQYLESHYTQTSEASTWLTGQLAGLKENVEESERKLTEFEKENGIFGMDAITPAGETNNGGQGQIHSPIIQKLDALNQELTTAEANRIEKEAIYRFAKTGNAEALAGIAKDPIAIQSHSAVLSDGGLSNLNGLLQRLGEVRLNLANASKTYGENSRHLKFLQNQAQEIEVQVRGESERIAKIAEADYELAKQTESQLRAQFDVQQGAANKLNEKAVQFAVLSQEAFSRKKLYEDLYTKLQEANVSAGLKATNITIIDPARSPSYPIRPKLFMNSVIGLVVGIIFGLVGAFVLDSADRTITLPGQVEEVTGRHVLGVVPSINSQNRVYGSSGLVKRTAKIDGVTPEDSLWMLSRPNSSMAEACRSLRTSIMLSRAGASPGVVLVTSCVAREGKTTLTANLAISYAQSNKKVLLVDADMRRPRINNLLGLNAEAGLSNVLTGSSPLNDVIVRDVRIKGLDVLTAGPHPPLPSEILGSREFEDLMERLRSQYEVVFIDSPPALIVTDAVIMSTQADALVWVARSGAVTKPLLSRARAMIERNQMPLVGFVVNGIDLSAAEYRYDYYGSRDGNGYYVS